MSILFVEQLTVLDFAYLDPQRGLVGESWIVDVELEGELDHQSMVLDFGEVKRRLKQRIDTEVDHTLLIPGRAPGAHIREAGPVLEIRFESERGLIEHRSPRCAVTVLPLKRIDCDAVAAHLAERTRPVVPSSVRRVSFALRPEAIEGPSYHYVHGLKKHDGHCQRIAHGHRSRIEIRVGGQRDADLEGRLAADWADIYIATREDLVGEEGRHLQFAYEAPEGRFELSLPAACVDLIDTDSTVECIAQHLLGRAAALRPGAAVEVRAYEGVMKGAIARN